MVEGDDLLLRLPTPTKDTQFLRQPSVAVRHGQALDVPHAA
jgi:hypothetical protein